MICVDDECVDIIGELLLRGANPYILNDEGESAYESISEHHTEISIQSKTKAAINV